LNFKNAVLYLAFHNSKKPFSSPSPS